MTDPGRSGGEGTGHPAGCQCRGMYGWGCAQDRETRLVLDPVTARDTIAEAFLLAMDGDFLPGAGMSLANSGGDVPLDKARPKEVAHWAARVAVAALASQERGDG